ncbi:hypothetical protein [Anatilimnocola floriformis]|uniref:hypothetical protein n=1 Tax=Anatilimnocola floriformis TaxID=2948575 RepID=UPI0020C23236|nr:hypothetical protein [Anatilimnocola floriformis]
MIEFGYEFTDTSKRVTDAAAEASFKNAGHAAASIRKDAINSIEKSDSASLPNTPPHTRKGLLPRSIVYFEDKAEQMAITGPRFSFVGESGRAHEFGEEFRGEEFEERAFMGPALDRNAARFASSFAGSIGV